MTRHDFKASSPTWLTHAIRIIWPAVVGRLLVRVMAFDRVTPSLAIVVRVPSEGWRDQLRETSPAILTAVSGMLQLTKPLPGVEWEVGPATEDLAA